MLDLGQGVFILNKKLPILIITATLVALIAMFAKDVIGVKGQVILFVGIVIAYIWINLFILRVQKRLKNQLSNIDTDLRISISEELEKDGILRKSKDTKREN